MFKHQSLSCCTWKILNDKTILESIHHYHEAITSHEQEAQSKMTLQRRDSKTGKSQQPHYYSMKKGGNLIQLTFIPKDMSQRSEWWIEMMQQPEVMLINAPSPDPAKERVPAIKYQHHLASHQGKFNMVRNGRKWQNRTRIGINQR